MSECNQPRVLIVETTSRAGQVALAHGDTVRALRRLDEARRHARDLAPAVAEMLSECGWHARELDAVFVSRGPGSYTGLRVGIMSVKALAYATGCALLGVDTFAAIALQAPEQAERLDVLADAQQGKVYVQSFSRAAARAWQPANTLTIQPFAAWMAARHSTAWVSGPGLTVYERQLTAGIPRADAVEWHPRAESLLRLGLERLRAGQRDDAWTLEPTYLRPSAAEEQCRAGVRG